MEKKVDILEILRQEGKLSKVIIYPAKEVITDPYEKTTDKEFLNPVTIKAYVTQISFEALKWKYTGQMPGGSVQILCEKRWENLFKIADKIIINDESYKCWKDDSKNFMIMKREDYMVVILGKKND